MKFDVNINQSIIFVLETTDLNGYVIYKSSIKHGNKCDYFEVTLALETKEVRLVIFNIDVYEKFILQSSVSVTKVAPSNEDFIFNDVSSVYNVDLSFALKRFPKPVTSLNDCINTCNLYDRVTILVKIIDVYPAAMSSSNLPYQECQIVDADSEHSRQLTLYGDLVNRAQLDTCYKFTHVTISKFRGSRVLKSSDQSEMQELPGAIINVAESVQSTIIQTEGTVCHVVFDSLEEKILCPKCKNPVQVEEKLIICTPCNSVSYVSANSSSRIVDFHIRTLENEIIKLKSPHAQLEGLCDVSINNKIAFFEKDKIKFQLYKIKKIQFFWTFF